MGRRGALLGCLVLLIPALLATSFSGGSVSGSKAPPVFWLHSAGQSNMVGKSDEAAQTYAPTADIPGLVYHRDPAAWEDLDDPVHENEGATASWWPRLGEMIADRLGFETRLVASAVSGSAVENDVVGICEWDPDHSFADSCSKQALRSIKRAGAPRVDAVLWNQGEADSVTQGAEQDAYEAGLLQHFDDFAGEYPDAPTVVIPVQLALHQATWSDGKANAKAAQLSAIGKRTFLSESVHPWDGMEFASDNTHITDTWTAANRLFDMLLAVLPFERVMPRQIHVDNGCSPCGDGTEAVPYGTIGEAVAAATPGSAIYVQGGTDYTGAGGLDFKNEGISGEKGRPIVVVPADSTTPVIAPSSGLCGNHTSWIWMRGIGCDGQGVDENDGTQINAGFVTAGEHNIWSKVRLRGNPASAGVQIQNGAAHNRLLDLDVDFTPCSPCVTPGALEAVAVQALAEDTYILGGSYACTEHSCFQIDGDGTKVARVTASMKTSGEAIMLVRHTVDQGDGAAPGDAPVIVEHNRFTQSSAGDTGGLVIQVNGMPGGIIRRNLIHREGGQKGIAIFNSSGGPNTTEIAGLRIDRNVIVGNPNLAIDYDRDSGDGSGCPTAALDLHITNNLIYDNGSDVANEQIEITRQCEADGNTGLDASSRIANNLIGDDVGSAVLDIDADGGESITSAESTYSEISGNYAQDFEICDTTADDYAPGKDDTWLREAGIFATTITTATGSGTSFDVGDASHFYEGGEAVPGDTIKTAGGAYAVVTGISGSTLTVNRSISWTQGEGVHTWWEDHSAGVTGGPAPAVGFELHGCKFGEVLSVASAAASLSVTPASQTASVEEDSTQTAGWTNLTLLHDGDVGSADVSLDSDSFTVGPEDCATTKTDWVAVDCSACPATLAQGASCTCTVSETDVDACDVGTWDATYSVNWSEAP